MFTVNRAMLLLAMGSVLIVSLLCLPNGSEAQDINFARLQSGTTRIQMSFGLEPALVTTVGYGRGITLMEQAASVDLDIGVVAAQMDLHDMRARIGLQTTFWRRGDWRIAGRGRLIARKTRNSIYEGAGFAADLTSHAGFYSQRWFAATSIGYDRTAVMHIKHGDWYREHFYEEAVDGWYRGKAGIFHGGLVAGVAIRSVEVALRFDLRRLDGGESLDPPFVGGVTVSHEFGSTARGRD